MIILENILIDNNGDKYQLNPISSRILSFRKQEMEKIDSNERVLWAFTNENKFPLSFLNVNDEVQMKELEYLGTKFFKKVFHRLENHVNLKDYYHTTLNSYFNCCDVGDRKIVKILDDDSTKYFLLTQKNYIRTLEHNVKGYRMDGILNIPESLYYVHLFQNGDFTKITDEWLYNLSYLFDFSKLSTPISDKQIKNDSESIKRLQKIYAVEVD